MKKLSSVFLIFLSICFTVGAQVDSDISKKDQRLFNKTIQAYANQKFEKALVLIDESMESDDLKKLGTVSLLEANILFALNDLENAKSSYLKAIQLSKPGDRIISIAQIGLARSMLKINILKEAEFEKNADDSLENSTEEEGKILPKKLLLQ
jgi:tetratricopeptide (TPR) repeat protein